MFVVWIIEQVGEYSWVCTHTHMHTHTHIHYRGNYIEGQKMFHSFLQQQIHNTCQAPASNVGLPLTKLIARWGRHSYLPSTIHWHQPPDGEKHRVLWVCRGRTLIPAMTGKEFGKRSLKDGDQPRRADNSTIRLLIKNVNEFSLAIPGAAVRLSWSEVKVAQSCPTLCNPMDCIVHGILQARILEW